MARPDSHCPLELDLGYITHTVVGGVRTAGRLKRTPTLRRRALSSPCWFLVSRSGPMVVQKLQLRLVLPVQVVEVLLKKSKMIF